MSGQQLGTWVRDEVFPFFAEMALSIPTPRAICSSTYCGQPSKAGELGQFCTPHHIIRTIVDLVDPIGETVYDPAAGMAGFLVAAYEHIRLANSSPNGRKIAQFEGKTFERGYDDRLSAIAPPTDRDLLGQRRGRQDGERGLDEPGAARPARRAHPQAQRADHRFDPQVKHREGAAARRLRPGAPNPPFSGRIDRDRIVDDAARPRRPSCCSSKYMVDNLEPGGRCGMIVPEGVLFGRIGAHKEPRRMLMQNDQVEAMLSLPGGVFQPYSGVKTSVLVFAKGRTYQPSAVPARQQRWFQARRQSRTADRGR
jgi:type I restriction enzyme M protein